MEDHTALIKVEDEYVDCNSLVYTTTLRTSCKPRTCNPTLEGALVSDESWLKENLVIY